MRPWASTPSRSEAGRSGNRELGDRRSRLGNGTGWRTPSAAVADQPVGNAPSGPLPPGSPGSGPAASGEGRPWVSSSRRRAQLRASTERPIQQRERPAARRRCRPARRRPRAGAGAPHRRPAIEGAEDRDVNGPSLRPGEVAAGDGAVRGAELADGRREPVGEVLHPGDPGFRRHGEATTSEVARVPMALMSRRFCARFSADVVAGGPVRCSTSGSPGPRPSGRC